MMTQLIKASNIWVLKPTKADLVAGAKYASLTLPWTFNRMMMNTGSNGQKSRALNIAKGIVAQEVLGQAFRTRGIEPKIQRKSYRDNDLFDFQIPVNGSISKIDIKTINYYNNYAPVGRSTFSEHLIIKFADYPGPDWRIFFPMLVPHTQIGQGKEAYCFAIASSIDFRQDTLTERAEYAFTAFPHAEILSFCCSKTLCLGREEAEKGIFLKLSYDGALLGGNNLAFTILGEWNGETKIEKVLLKKGKAVKDIGPFSCVSSFQISKETYDSLFGTIEISISKNEFTKPVYNSYMKDINNDPGGALTFTRDDFCNLILPNDYTIYIIGWITKNDFLTKCWDYTGWVWPVDRIDKFKNQPWSTITEKDKKALMKAGFEDAIQKKPSLVTAGWMKTTGRGGGACCYVFPNIGHNGGVKEHNLYVLPKNLEIMDQLGV
jgi:hypothetical protein